MPIIPDDILINNFKETYKREDYRYFLWALYDMVQFGRAHLIPDLVEELDEDYV